MMRSEFKNLSVALLAGLLLLSASTLFAQDAEWVYQQRIEKAKTDRLAKKYKEAAVAATQAFHLTEHMEQPAKLREKAIELSISANAAAKNSGIEFNGPWSAIILKEDGKILLLEKGTICRGFEIFPGIDFSVPSGSYTVSSKLGYPHLELNGKLFRSGDQDNFLGSRWVELKNPEGVPVTGIHGKSHEEKSHADELFFRMKNTDVNEVFSLLAEGSKVEVK